jgi:hypothetical protein
MMFAIDVIASSFVVKRQGAGLTAGIYNTLGLNDCPQATWDAIDIAKVASQFGAIRVISNGPGISSWTVSPRVTSRRARSTSRVLRCGPSLS